MNPYKQLRTPHEERLIEAGRAKLLAYWNSLSDYRVEFYTRELVANDTGFDTNDVFCIKDPPPSFPEVWERERQRTGFTFEQYADRIDIIVPHTHYLKAQRCCMSVDAVCVANTLLYGGVIVSLLYSAYIVNP